MPLADIFRRAMLKELATIRDLTDQSEVLKAISFEQYSKEIQGVMTAIDDAVQTFLVHWFISYNWL